MRKLSVLHLLLFAVLLAFQGCQKEQLDEKNFKIQPKNETLDNVKSQKGILTFRNRSEFENVMNALENAKESDRIAFESRLGFHSLLSAYTIASKNAPQISDKSFTNSEELIAEENGRVVLKFFDPKMANVLTKEGYVIIGFTLHQFYNRKVKSVELSEELRIADAINMLKTVEKSNNKVRVSPVKLIESLPLNGTEQGARVGVGGHEVWSPYGCSGGDLKFAVRGKVNLACYDWQEVVCDYLYYDEDCRCMSCLDQDTRIVRGRRLFLTVEAESRLRNQTVLGTRFEQEGPNPARYTKATGSLVLYYDGSSFSYPVNLYAAQTSFSRLYIIDDSYSNVQNISTVEIGGTVNYEAHHYTVNCISRVTQYL